MQVSSAPGSDPRLQPTPDYGSLGPGADTKSPGRNSIEPTGGPSARAYAMVCTAIAIGVLAAAVSRSGIMGHIWESMNTAPRQRYSRRSSSTGKGGVDRAAQSQAESLLQRAEANDQDAKAEIQSHLEDWQGKIALTDRMNGLVYAGLNSDDYEVRAATIDVDLAALSIRKNSGSVDTLESQALAGPQNQRVWALWTLGLLGNRGVEQGRVAGILQSQLHDSNVEVRHWAVEGLAYLGTSEAIEPVLKAMHDDPSPTVRERAACSLAQSGMFTHEQRQSVVPTLIGYAEDSALDASTHAWTYHALSDITGQHFANDPAAWRNWYNSTSH